VPISNEDPASANTSILLPSFGTIQEAKLYGLQSPYSRPHARPGSVAIVTIGTMWEPGSFKAVVDMAMYQNKLGLTCWFAEIKDPRGGIPYQFLQGMFDHGVTQARNRGFDYVLMVQTDVLPEPDLLMKLLTLELPIVAPIILDPASGHAVGGPPHEPNTGIKKMRWIPLPFVLFKSNVFNCFGPIISTGAVTEDLFWERFNIFAHWPYLDTGNELKMAKHASRAGNLTLPEQWQWWVDIDERKRGAIPDRSSPNPNDPHQDGVYWPLPDHREDNLEEEEMGVTFSDGP
jgi:hypothetical protein